MTGFQSISSPYFEDGFLPTQPAVSRLPRRWEVWEDILSEATSTLGFELCPCPEGIPGFEGWRESVQKACTDLHRTRHILLIYTLVTSTAASHLTPLDASIVHARAPQQPPDPPSSPASFNVHTPLLHPFGTEGSVTHSHLHPLIPVGPITCCVRASRLTANLHLLRHDLLQLLHIRSRRQSRRFFDPLHILIHPRRGALLPNTSYDRVPRCPGDAPDEVYNFHRGRSGFTADLD